MTLEEARSSIKRMVRITVQSKSWHKSSGRIINVDGKHVLVLPNGRHRKLERILPESLKIWKKGNLIQARI